MKSIGESVSFGRRHGTIVAHTTFRRAGAVENETFYVVELRKDSQGYLEKLPGAPDVDCFISAMIVHPSNVD